MLILLRTTRWVGLAAFGMTAATGGLLFAPPALARIVNNTIDPVALVADHGRHLVVTGPIACTAGEHAYLELTVTQRATGAVAAGRTRFACSGTDERWEVHAATRDRASFEEGRATAVVLARTGDGGRVTDAQQWLVAITLVNE